MMRGETQGRANIAWYGIKTPQFRMAERRQDQLALPDGAEEAPRIPPEVPLGLDLAKNAADRQVLQLKFSAYDVGYAFMAPPEISPNALRRCARR